MNNRSARDNSIQSIKINSDAINFADKKQARIELRALRDAFYLKTVKPNENTESIPQNTVLKRVTAYCTAEKINLKHLSSFLRNNPMFQQSVIYFGECLYTSVAIERGSVDVFFFDYGVTVFWGVSENVETKILKIIKISEYNSYDTSKIEVENFQYGIIDTQSMFCNDVIYLNTEDYFHKMIISNAIAQSVKLDYFENLTDKTIESVKDLPEEVENWGRVGRNRKEILKMVGRLHKLRIDLNLVTNILDEPEVLWHFPRYSELYESLRRCLEIKARADILNLRCDVIHGVLEILSENINTRNSENLEKMMVGLIFVSIVVGIFQILVLLLKR